MQPISNLKIESAVAYVGVFTALSILLGYVFQLGFLSPLDDRLMQFLTVEDYVETSASYIFLVPVLYLVFSVGAFSDFSDTHRGVIRLLTRAFQDPSEFTPKTLAAMARARLVLFGIAMAFLVSALLVAVWRYFDKDLISRDVYFGLYMSALGFGGISGFFGALEKAKAVSERQLVGYLFLVIALLASMYAYGLIEGKLISEQTANNVHIELDGGTNFYGILVNKYSEGAVVRVSGGSSVKFIPNSQIQALELSHASN